MMNPLDDDDLILTDGSVPHDLGTSSAPTVQRPSQPTPAEKVDDPDSDVRFAPEPPPPNTDGVPLTC